MTSNKYSLLFQLTFRAIKYFFLALIGFAIAFILAIGLGKAGIAISIFPLVFEIIYRMGIILLCLIAITMLIESLR
ncbi:MAG: hypothetical protein AAF378_07070 [Cyanobacteria bacterium P01_A01_bin.84]